MEVGLKSHAVEISSILTCSVDYFQTHISQRYTSIQQAPQPVLQPALQPICVPYQPVNYSWNGLYGYQQNAFPSNYMPSTPQDAKEYFFGLECPELIDHDTNSSPTCSAFSSGTSFPPQSPSLDAKEVPSGYSTSIFTPSNMSPLSNFGFADVQCNAETAPVWPMQQAMPPCTSSQQLGADVWSCSQYPCAQSVLSTNVRSSVMAPQLQVVQSQVLPPQPQSQLQPQVQVNRHFNDLRTQPCFEEMVPMMGPSNQSTRGSSLQHTAPSFIGYGDSGLVVPGSFFNTPLDRPFLPQPTSTMPSSNTSLISPTDTASSFTFPPGPSLVITSSSDMSSLPEEPVSVQARPLPEAARNAKDDYLQEARRRGLSYKEIKRRGGFTEAESTLRGRIRILSKPKEMRVRKPQWSRADIMLLHRAVTAMNPSQQPPSTSRPRGRKATNVSKLPWKKIAEHMQDNGASYPFAGATCAKKWEQVRGMNI